MRDHWWWRPGVWPGRELLVWHILPDDGVRRLAGACHELLRDVSGLDLVPLDWLHMTTLVVGPRDEIPPAASRSMVRTAREAMRDLAPITVELGEPRVHAEGVTVGPRPPYALRPIWERVCAASSPVIPRLPDDWWAHLSVAYGNAPAPDAPIADALWPAPAPVEWTVRSVHLVAQRRTGHLYHWEPVATVPLG